VIIPPTWEKPPPIPAAFSEPSAISLPVPLIVRLQDDVQLIPPSIVTLALSARFKWTSPDIVIRSSFVTVPVNS
jgi:hypothetical protein